MGFNSGFKVLMYFALHGQVHKPAICGILYSEVDKDSHVNIETVHVAGQL